KCCPGFPYSQPKLRSLQPRLNGRSIRFAGHAEEERMHASLEHLQVEVDLCGAGWDRIVGRNPQFEVVARDIIFGEGPVWDARAGVLYFTDIIGDTIWKWTPGVGQEVVLRPSVKAHGLCLDLEHRLLVAGWGGRT